MEYRETDFFWFLKTPKSVEATKEDMTCCSSIIDRIRSGLIQDGAMSMIPPSEWMDSSYKLSGIASTTRREQYYPHSRLEENRVHEKSTRSTKNRSNRQASDSAKRCHEDGVTSICRISASTNGSQATKICKRNRS